MARMVGWAVLLQALIATAAPGERAEVQACIRASTRGQELRDSGDLLGARSEFRGCAIQACPQAIRSDCARWLADVQQAVPSVVLVVREGQTDLTDAEIAVDGKVVQLEGRPLELNPGPHRVSATRDGTMKSESLIVSAGERNRLFVISWVPALSPAPVAVPAPLPVAVEPPRVAEQPPPPSSPAPPASRVSESSTSPSLAGPLALAGAGVVGVVVFASVGAWGQSELNSLSASPCGQARTCAPGAADGVRTKFVAADIGLGVGLVGLASAALWYFVPSSNAVSLATDGRSVAVAGHFTF
jgi:hypothetical protein